MNPDTKLPGNTMIETEFTPWSALAGGILIGLAATLLMALHGRIAGMTGITTGFLPPIVNDWGWRAAFLAGAVIAPAVYGLAVGGLPVEVPVSMGMVALSGLIVGIGVYFGSGCTSGHGVCGMARLSRRSIVATATFMATTFATVFVIRHVIGS